MYDEPIYTGWNLVMSGHKFLDPNEDIDVHMGAAVGQAGMMNGCRLNNAP